MLNRFVRLMLLPLLLLVASTTHAKMCSLSIPIAVLVELTGEEICKASGASGCYGVGLGDGICRARGGSNCSNADARTEAIRLLEACR